MAIVICQAFLLSSIVIDKCLLGFMWINVKCNRTHFMIYSSRTESNFQLLKMHCLKEDPVVTEQLALHVGKNFVPKIKKLTNAQKLKIMMLLHIQESIP